MREKSAYETGARKYPARTGPDPSDDFSQDAAGNKPPASGAGLSEKVDAEKKHVKHRDNKEVPPEPAHVDPPPRDVREAPTPNPNGKPIKKD